MRVRHYLGFPLLAIGASGGFEDRVRKGLRNHRGPGDYGNVDYHQGAYEGSHSSDGGGDGGGGD